ncbi:MAG: DUF1223 domain-containing protein [Bacteroidetes bacterium]|nr:DUF1223 domain-containing protein [Bacteroidota bacterium]
MEAGLGLGKTGAARSCLGRGSFSCFDWKGLNTIILAIIFSVTASFDTAEKPKPFAVVELFTAEGCSSCPAADDLLKEMTEILQKEGKEVLSLSFHVTYWNKYGWEDIYSNEIFTDRQKNYVNSLKLQQLYTPQAIVNGEQEFIGSDPINFRNKVVSALGVNPVYSIHAQAKKENSEVALTYELNKEPKNVLLNIAIVENSIVHRVLRGENKDRTLKHYNVVRSFKTVMPKAKEEIKVGWPEGLAKDRASIILYLQNSKSLKITGAVKVDMQK